MEATPEQELIARSDERDMYLQRVLEAEKRGYERGYGEGYEAGLKDYYAAREEDWEGVQWHLIGIFQCPDFDELDKLRYPPDGRVAQVMGDASPGEYTGGVKPW